MTTSNTKSSMDSTFPVVLPEDAALFMPNTTFEQHVHDCLRRNVQIGGATTGNEKAMTNMDIDSSTNDDDFTVVSNPVKESFAVDPDGGGLLDQTVEPKSQDKFMDALLNESKDPSFTAAAARDLSAENKMLTENAGVAHRSTNSPLLDLFSELEKTVSGPRLRELLEASWKEDALATLKIVWNARSIHLGKSDKETFYRCLGWIKTEHPETVIANLPWMFRSVIEKKVKKKSEDEPVMVEKEGEEAKNDYEVLHGVSHGYWKDLLNLLVLAVTNEFHVLGDPHSVLYRRKERLRGTKTSISPVRRKKGFPKSLHALRVTKPQPKPQQKPQAERIKQALEFNAKQKQDAKDKKHQEEAHNHRRAVNKLEDPFYRALHLTVARLFAEQLRKDMDLLKAGKRKDIDHISLAAKWAPSLEGFHDRYTFIASSIAEILFPRSIIRMEGDTREIYLKRAREQYRYFALSPLRKALEIVERDITAGTFQNIKYEKVPSIAMNNNKDLFARKDFARFEKYIEDVVEGKSRISGAVLLPSTLVHQARKVGDPDYQEALQELPGERVKGSPNTTTDATALLMEKMALIQTKVIDGQWNTLVQRIKDNGKLQSSIAVCDVSGSMGAPRFPDGTCPMDTSIGLALLLAEITEPPFGGAFITFSERPQIQQVGGPNDMRTFPQKVRAILNSDWGMNTNYVAVFETLILPMAIKNKLKQEDMVKQIFVFSDMQFDEAQYKLDGLRWQTAHTQISQMFTDAGYEIPKLIFWNLAGGRAGYTGNGDPVAPKPVTQDEEGTALVAGYSQAQLKMFLEEGQFEDEEVEDEVTDEDMDESAEGAEAGTVEISKKQKKKDPMATLRKATSHKAYDMLRVVD
ncbi:MAG: hypothetical protein M1830_001093 [Pleopsidium flavum]|nr:MAG: hypothetical protein M1830_001093 [Pleopsidium flavum]